jgi:hypothetical protein
MVLVGAAGVPPRLHVSWIRGDPRAHGIPSAPRIATNRRRRRGSTLVTSRGARRRSFGERCAEGWGRGRFDGS